MDVECKTTLHESLDAHQSNGSPAEGKGELAEEIVVHFELLQLFEGLEAVGQGADVVVGQVQPLQLVTLPCCDSWGWGGEGGRGRGGEGRGGEGGEGRGGKSGLLFSRDMVVTYSLPKLHNCPRTSRNDRSYTVL